MQNPTSAAAGKSRVWRLVLAFAFSSHAMEALADPAEMEAVGSPAVPPVDDALTVEEKMRASAPAWGESEAIKGDEEPGVAEAEAVAAAAAAAAAVESSSKTLPLDPERGVAVRAARESSGNKAAGRRIVVTKSSRRLQVIEGGVEVFSAPVVIGARPDGPKVRRGDKRTPEGEYHVERRKGGSSFYKAIAIDYPNAADRAHAAAAGIDPGDDILLHGQPLSKAGRAPMASTDGCVALSNRDMDIVWALAVPGTAVEIKP